MTARGDKLKADRHVDAMLDLERELGTKWFPDCDWGGRHDGSTKTVAFRKNGGQWIAVCEHHATGPNVRRPVSRG